MTETEISILESIAHLVRKNPNLLDHVISLCQKIGFENAQSILNIESTFNYIYKNNLWHSNESVSGPGSELFYTENLRKELPKLFSNYNIKSVLDAPCGDFNWMKEVLKNTDIIYYGGDIVYDLIDKNQLAYGSKNVNFLHLDITCSNLISADLIICRDCLFHLSFQSIRNFFLNFIKSDIKYILTTTHYNEANFQNCDIDDGGFRLIDLFASPFFLTPDPLEKIEDWIPGHPKRMMCLWSKNQIEKALPFLSNLGNRPIEP
jgi:hypothetical protein